MSITKQSVIDQITITENGVCMYRTVTKIIENNLVLTQAYHRDCVYPGQSLSDMPEKVAIICAAAWTPDVVAAYKEAHQ